jgi:modulator of FtsH protease HflK
MNGEKPQVPSGAPDSAVDSGSQALSEALRSSFGIVKIVMGLLIVLFIFSGFFVVGPQERALVLHFGRAPVEQGEKALLGPGLHFSWPYPIDEYVKIPITGVQKANSTACWYATTPAAEAAGTEPPPGPTLNPGMDGYGITADENIVHSRATVTYRISDPVRFEFGLSDARRAITNALDDALLYATAHYQVDDILTRDRIGFRELVLKRAIQLADAQNLGVTIEQCTINSIPPRQQNVRQAFDDVLKAEIDRSKKLDNARSYENTMTNRAVADAAGKINLAESERVRMVNEVSSRAQQFSELLPKYQENPTLFVQQRLMDTLGRAFTNVQDKILVPESMDGNQREIRYLINRELPKPKTEEPTPPK